MLWGGKLLRWVLGTPQPFGDSPATAMLPPLPPEAPVGRLLAGFPWGHVGALPKAGEEAVRLQRAPAVPLRAQAGGLQELLVAPRAHRPVLGLVPDLYGDAGLQHTKRRAQPRGRQVP